MEKKMRYKKPLIAGLAASLLTISVTAAAEGNRYDKERRYHSEISAAEAFLVTHFDRGNARANPSANAVLIDVRSIPEYVAGHPGKAMNIPYPRIHPDIDPTLSAEQKKQQFLDAVVAAIPDKNTPILTLCKTGSRSIDAANILADAGYTQVRNIWEGFEGRTKIDTSGNTLDLNNDGVVGDSGDLDGWKNFAALPYSTKLRPTLIYSPLQYLYYQ
jgi:rhodanese-related sulfurtransferase